MTGSLARLIGAALGLMLVGCTPLRPGFTGFESLAPNEVAVVGQVRLDPPLGPGEQDPGAPTAVYEIKDRFYMDVADQVRELDTEVTVGLGANSIQARLGVSFRVVLPTTDRFLNGGYIVMKQMPPVEVSAFPLGAEIPLEPADRAVYIGTVVYHRDRYNECVQIEIVDDYEKEAADFAKQFGATPKLEKRLLREVPGAPGRADPSGSGESRCHF